LDSPCSLTSKEVYVDPAEERKRGKDPSPRLGNITKFHAFSTKIQGGRDPKMRALAEIKAGKCKLLDKEDIGLYGSYFVAPSRLP
jgi:hypothetical protein